jgi:Pyruvate/2-oxoacid:ferredoxin oxidoreductase delta subunit
VAAKKCDHPNQVCMQFGKRAEYDLFRGSGRKVSVDEAIAIAAQAGNTGLVPTVSNLSDLNQLDFICFCCGCCCLVINPGVRVGGLQRILAPSRYVSTVDADLCNTCGECAERCVVNAIAVSEAACVMVVDRDKCLGCGACVLACPVDGGIGMEVARPPEFIPEAGLGPLSILMDM